MRKFSLLSLAAALVVALSVPVAADLAFSPSTTSGAVGSTVTFQNTSCFADQDGGWARVYIGADQSLPWAYTETTAAPLNGFVGDVDLVVPDNAVVGPAQLWIECEDGNLPDGPPGYISPPQDFTVTAGGGGGEGGESGGTGGGTGSGTGGGGTGTGGTGADDTADPAGTGDTADTGASAVAPEPVSAMPTFTG